MKKNLVMGSGSGFDWNIFEPFVTSFVRHAKNTELVLFVKDLSAFTTDRIKRCGGGASIRLEPFEHTNYIGIERFKNFKRYMDAHGDEYEQILITDTRDVIFQGDIFEHFKNYPSFLAYATEGDDIRGSKIGMNLNYKLIDAAFGKEVADKLSDKKIICAGSALIGTPNEMKIFLEILSADNREVYPFGFDQAAFNYLIYNNLIPIENLMELDIHSGEILNLALNPNIVVRDEKILRGDGGVPAVVHQYDRYAPLVQIVDRLYRDKNFQVDEQFNDTRSNLEQVWQLLYFGRDDDAAQFCMKKLVGSADISENIDLALKIWEHVTKKPVTPAIGYLELAIQNILTATRNFSFEQLNKIRNLLTNVAAQRRMIYPAFVNFITTGLRNIAEQSLNANIPAQCFFCIDLINSLELPPDKDFYLLVARANRTFGKKIEALEAYKKALDLS